MPDWSVSLSDPGQDGLPAGSTLVYELDIFNGSFTDSAAATTVTFTVDTGTSMTSGGGLDGCIGLGVAGPTTVTCDVPEIDPDTTVSFLPEILSTTSGTTTLSASVPTTGDGDPGNNAASQPTTLVEGADIAVSVTAGPAIAASSEFVSYTFTAESFGPDQSDGFEFVFPIPPGLDVTQAPFGCTLAGGEYTCEIDGPFDPGDTIDLTFDGQVTVASGSTLTLQASVENGSPSDGQADNNVTTFDTSVTAGSDVFIEKIASSDVVLVGDEVIFTLSPGYLGDEPTGLEIVDLVPGNYLVTDIDDSGSPFDCSASVGNSVECELASGGSSGSVSLGTITITADVLSSDTDPVANTATISSDAPVDPNPGNDSSSDGGVDLQDPFVDHAVNKEAPSPNIVAVGSSYDFELSSTNLGNAEFTGTLIIEDVLPAALTADSYDTNGWLCTPAAPQTGPVTIRCEFDYTTTGLAAGATTPVITISTTVNSLGSIENIATVSAEDANIEDTNTGNDSETEEVTGQGALVSTDISVSKVANVASLPSGGEQTFVLEVLNNGPAVGGGAPVDSLDVVLTDTLNGLVNNLVGPNDGLVSVTKSDGSATGVACSTTANGSLSRQLTCTIDVLPQCTSGSDCPTVTVVTRPGGDAGNRNNVANVVSNTTADTNPNNNRAEASYSITAETDVTIEKSALPDPAIVGQELVYVITAQNQPVNIDGNNIALSAAQGVIVTDTFPDDLTYVSAVPSSGICTTEPDTDDPTGPTNNTLICELGQIGSNSTQTVTVTVLPNNETLNNLPIAVGATGPQIENIVSISTTTDESNTGNNTGSVITDIETPAFDILVNKVDSIDPVGVNEPFSYAVEVRNLGPSAVENVVLEDTMPASNIAFVSASADDTDAVCTPDTSSATDAVNIGLTSSVGVIVECTIPYIPAGETVTVTINARGDEEGSVSNNAVVSAEGSASFGTNAFNNDIDHSTTVRTRVDVQVNSKTTTAASYNLGENFDWVIEIENEDNATEFYGVARGVEVTDQVPANMIITAPPTWPAGGAGETSGGTCSVSGNNRRLDCEIGTMAIGEVIQITVPVRVTSVSAEPQTFSNTAEISTTSLDDDDTNNEATGSVDINSSSISGLVFRDFNDNGDVEGTDTGVAGIELTLTGTDLNGDTISSITVTTAADGTYEFPFLAEGDYVITRGTVAEAFQSDGQNRQGTGGALYTGNTSPTVSLGGNDEEPDWDFAIVPQTRIGLAKTTGTTTRNADGTVDVTFDFVIENFSLEALDNIVLDDELEGGAPLFGTYTAATTPAGGLNRGTYTVLTAPSGSCTSINADFTGATGELDVINGATIAAGGTCTVSFEIRINPTDPLPTGDPQYENSATVDGEGVLSGQTSGTNPLLSDVSDDGTNPDANDNGSGGDADEDDPTPVDDLFDTDITLEKTASTSLFADELEPVPGDVIEFTYVVRNTTDVNVFDIDVSENAPGAQAAGFPPNFSGTGTLPTIGAGTGGSDIDGDGDLPDLAPGAFITYTATYAITQDDINAGEVLNTATVTATDVYGDPLTDFSDDTGVTDVEDYNSDGNPDDPTITPLPRVVELEVVKSITAESYSSPFLLAGDTVSYQFFVTNIGNVDIDAVTPTDPGPTFGGEAATGSALVFATTDDTDLGPSESATFTATYTLTAKDVENFYTSVAPVVGIENTASVTGTPPPGTTITSTPDSTETGVAPSPSIVLTKEITAVTDANSNSILGDAGDTVTYDLIVTNTGNTSLGSIGITDAELGLVDVPLNTPSAGAALAPGASGSITGQNYTITPLNLAEGEVVNTATVSATPVATKTDGTADESTALEDATSTPLADVTDTSDTLTEPQTGNPGTVQAVTDPAADGGSTPTVVELPTVSADITLTKRVDNVADANANGIIGDAGDTVTYTLEVTNTGTTALADILVTDTKLSLSQNVGDLAIGASTQITGLPYTITTDDQADREVINTATTAGDPVATGPGNAPDAGNPLVDNTNTDLPDVSDISDTLTEPDLDAMGNVDDVTDPDAGGTFDDPTIVNLPATGPAIELTKAITAVADTNGNGLIGDPGDTITYAFTVTNIGNSSLAGITITDTKLGISAASPTPDNLLPYESATLTGQDYVINTLDFGAGEVENTAVTQGQPVATDPMTDRPDETSPLLDDMGATLDPVEDTSDTRTDPDLDAGGNPVTTADPDADADNDAPTFLNLPTAAPEITITKTITAVNDVNGNGIIGDTGDTIEYGFTITNTGNTALAGIVIDDTKLGLSGVSPSPDALAFGDSVTFVPSAAYVIDPDDQGAGQVINSADATGTPVATDSSGNPDAGSPLLNDMGDPLADVEDTSDTRSDPDLDAGGNVVTTADPDADGNDDAPTILNLPATGPAIELTKAIAQVNDENGNGLYGDVGDTIVYDFTVTNTGNTALAGIVIDDAKLGLTDAAVLDQTLLAGESTTLVGQVYTVTAEDQGVGEVENTATTEGTPVATDAGGDPDPTTPLVDDMGAPLDPVTDISDTRTDPDESTDGTVTVTADPDADGNNDAPTILELPSISPEIELTKAITLVTDVNGNGLFGDVGDQITYDFTVTNTGNTSLTAIVINDDKLGLTGVAVLDQELAPTESTTLTGQVYTVTAEDQGVGEVINSAEAVGTPVATDPSGDPDPAIPLLDGAGDPLDPVTDLSDTRTDPDESTDGTVTVKADPDADGNDDAPTILELPSVNPEIELTKAIAQVIDENGNGLFGDAGDTIIYDFTVTNTGNTSLDGVTISDPKLGLTDVAVVDQTLAPGDSTVLTGQSYTVTTLDQGAGEVVNTATTEGTPVATDPSGQPDLTTPLLDDMGDPLDPVTDISDTRTDPDESTDGTVTTTADPDADGNDDAPTILTLPQPVPNITLVKSVVEVIDANNDLVLGATGDEILYSFTVTNSGDTALSGVTVSDPLIGFSNLAVSPSVLMPGDSGTATATLPITGTLFISGVVENSATTSATPVATGTDGLPDPTQPLLDETGTTLDPVTDISDTGSEPTSAVDGTIIPIADPAGTGTEDDPTVINIPLVPSDLVISGTVFFDNDRDGVLGAGDDPTGGAGYIIELVNSDGEVIATTVTDSNGFYEIEGFPTGEYTVIASDPGGEELAELGTFTFSETVQEIRDVDFPIIVDAPVGDLLITKSANVEEVVFGQTVTFEIVAGNLSGAVFGPVTIADTLPQGLSYVPGTTTLEGTIVTPEVSGRMISVTGLVLPAGGSMTVTLQAIVDASAPVGALVNVANLVDGITGEIIADPAEAAVIRLPEAVFDCSDVIGKVFDDRNFDGYQNPTPEEDRSAITNQDIFDDKFGKLQVPVDPIGEPGLPAVRLVTPTGSVITTDEHGRYSVPCAEFAGEIGTNFTLKLDPQSLPTGYRITTENPRTMRLTSGIVTEMNFGAALGRVVDVDFTAAAFDADDQPVAALEAGLAGLLKRVAGTPSVVRISYYAQSDPDDENASERIAAVDELIRELWEDIGRYRLIVETSILRGQ
ncbi:MAG: hypothetical protein MK180_14220 [Rhodobacteraceae bacterium]|nr:hypothetical protein [Paracoccaceae bacterium]